MYIIDPGAMKAYKVLEFREIRKGDIHLAIKSGVVVVEEAQHDDPKSGGIMLQECPQPSV